LVNVRKALPKNGAVLIAEPMETNQITNKAKSDAYFWLYLAAMGKGRPRTSSELESLLLKAGFSRSRRLKTTLPIQTGIVVGRV
jgi:demethylspheroidene O-methyltransferase